MGRALSVAPKCGTRGPGLRLAGFFALAVAMALPISPAHGQAAPTTAYTTASVRLRAEPSATSIVVTRLPRGARVAVAECDNGWCLATYRARHGYVLQQYLAESRPSSYSVGGRGYVNSRGIWVRSPLYAPEGQVPAGATAQCCDGSYSFSMSRRGTCSHHGGVCTWLGYR